MEWTKLKNIILAILAMTNLCLFFFVAHREWQQYHFQNQARSDAVAFLASRSITATPAQRGPSSSTTTGPFPPALPRGPFPPAATPPPAPPPCWSGWTLPGS